MSPSLPPLALLVALGLAGCVDKVLDVSGDREPAAPCEPGATTSCPGGLACEPRADPEGGSVCAARVELRGRVLDALDGSPVAGAHVFAADDSGMPVSAVVVTDADGRYALPVTMRRDDDGQPIDRPRWTLLVSAADYLPFPSGLRPALPVDAQELAPVDEPAVLGVVDNASTTVALIPLDRPGGVTLSGRVQADAPAGTMVVAEGPTPAPFGIADLDGAFSLFNVPAGSVTVRGHRQGLELEPVVLTVSDADVDDLLLLASDGATSTMAVVSGSVNIVDAQGGLATSVVLVPASVYDVVLERGPVPFGLRAPSPPDAPSVASRFEITGVPRGRYMALVALENDGLVRDPDTTIAGTAVQEIVVVGGETVELAEAAKITAALEIVGPGADGPEPVEGTPVFAWVDDAGEDRYAIVVHDALGNEVWRDDEVPRVTGGVQAEVSYGGPPLTPGMYYQFRVTAWRTGGQQDTPISRTEDLRGVFVPR